MLEYCTYFIILVVKEGGLNLSNRINNVNQNNVLFSCSIQCTQKYAEPLYVDTHV